MKNLLILFSLSIVLFSCEKKEGCVPESSSIEYINYEITDSTTLVEDDTTLDGLYNKITALSGSKDCSDEGDWTFTAYGSKACGGPIGYIAYSECINTADFLNKVSVFTELQNEYNTKYGIISPCDVPPSPISVDCEDGKPVLVY